MTGKKISTESKKNPSHIIASNKLEKLSKEEVLAIIHELESHQIELEIQNETLRESEIEILALRDAYSNIYDFAPVGYVMLNKKGSILKSNLTFSKMLNEPRANIINYPLSQFITENDQNIYYLFLNAIQQTHLEQRIELRIENPPGNSLWVRLYATCDEATDNSDFNIRLVLTDISDIKKAIDEKSKLENELYQSQKMEAIGQLTGGIAHDFNNILGIITGYLQLAKKQNSIIGDVKQSNYLKYIGDATTRATDLVSKMLSFTRKNEKLAKPVYLQSLLKHEHRVLFSGLPTSIKTNLTIDQTLPSVLFDKTQFDQLLINLVTNARDAMSEVGEIQIRLGWASPGLTTCSSCVLPIDDNWIELSITDNGTGMNAELLSSIFNPFFTTKEVGKGTGLGLSVTHGIMHSRGGHIVVESKVGIGTTFRLLFPPCDQEYSEETITEQEITPQVSTESKHILVVDDEASLTQLTTEYLEYYGYKVTSTLSSTKALELVKKHPNEFNLIITDQTMPDLSGIDLIQSIRKIQPSLPAILNSGYNEFMNAEKAAQLNIMFLQKPVDLDEVVSLVNELLGET
jgi:two-component system cell cycle sensor histidine kinase/response regulator CckA